MIINLGITLILLIINIHSSHAKLTKRVYIHTNARTQHRYHRFAIALKPPDSLQVPGSRENRWSRNTKRKGDERNDQRKKEEKKEKKEEAWKCLVQFRRGGGFTKTNLAGGRKMATHCPAPGVVPVAVARTTPSPPRGERIWISRHRLVASSST